MQLRKRKTPKQPQRTQESKSICVLRLPQTTRRASPKISTLWPVVTPARAPQNAHRTCRRNTHGPEAKHAMRAKLWGQNCARREQDLGRWTPHGTVAGRTRTPQNTHSTAAGFCGIPYGQAWSSTAETTRCCTVCACRLHLAGTVSKSL